MGRAAKNRENRPRSQRKLARETRLIAHSPAVSAGKASTYNGVRESNYANGPPTRDGLIYRPATGRRSISRRHLPVGLPSPRLRTPAERCAR